MSAVPHNYHRSRVWTATDGVWRWEVNRYEYRGDLLTIIYPPVTTGQSPWRWHARMQARMWRNRLEATGGVL